MNEEIKKALGPSLTLIKELNNKIKDDNIDGDTILKLATTMKLTSIQLEKISKKMSINAGLKKVVDEDEDEE